MKCTCMYMVSLKLICMKNRLLPPAQLAVSELCINGGVVKVLQAAACSGYIEASVGMVPQERLTLGD